MVLWSEPEIAWMEPVMPMETAALRARRNKNRLFRSEEMGPLGGFFANETLQRMRDDDQGLRQGILTGQGQGYKQNTRYQRSRRCR